MIPKKIHFVWIGDENKLPISCIKSWQNLNPDYQIKIWGNKELVRDFGWVNSDHMNKMLSHELNGVADMMRYEILFTEGGIALDADSFCLSPLEDWLLETDEFVCWENEHARPGLLACGAMGSVAGSNFFKNCVLEIKSMKSVVEDCAWKTVGPNLITSLWSRSKHPLTVYPSHYFYPKHHTGLEYNGSGKVFARQEWASTKNLYGFNSYKK